MLRKKYKPIKLNENYKINIMKNKIIFILVFLVFLTSCTKYKTIIINNGEGEIEVKAEIADSQEKRERGLMFRESLKENSGMYFTFDNDATFNFWMKNTLIPLDIIFISKDYIIVDIIQAEPCVEDPCESYKTTEMSRYVLEVNKDFTTINSIEVGDRIIIE